MRLFVVVLLTLAASAGCGGGSGKEGSGGREGSVVDAMELSREYRDDESAFRKKYKGKTMVIEGKLREIASLAGGAQGLVFVGAYDDQPPQKKAFVYCQFKETVPGVKAGDRVKIRADFHSCNSSHIFFDECEVIK